MPFSINKYLRRATEAIETAKAEKATNKPAMITLSSTEPTSSSWTQTCCSSPCLDRHRHEKTTATTTRAHRATFARSTKSTIFADTQFTNHESLPPFSEAYAGFTGAYPQFNDTRQADRIREDEYKHLAGHVCLDYTGLSLFSHSQLHSSSGSLLSISYSHLEGPTATESAVRNRIMRFLNVSESDYSMVCTANRTSAFKLLADTYPFQSSNRLLTVYDYDSEAENTLTEGAARRGARVVSASFSWPHLRIQSAKLKSILSRRRRKKKKKRGLFVFPLQSRMTGASYPYFWMRMAQENGWHVLLDTSALGPKYMDSFGLSLIQPDFIISSFFQLVGENPSGFATLFIKNSTRSILESSSSLSTGSVGIVNIVPSSQRTYESDSSEEISVENEEIKCAGFDHADSLGLLMISCRLRCITNWLVLALTKLRHPNVENGHSLVRIYGPRVKFDRGAALAFNVFDWKGEKVDPRLVQKLADRSDISLGCGFLRNICVPEEYGAENVGSGIAVVNASLGFLTNFEDAYRLWSFVANFLDADFVEKERWRYMALNQKIVEV